MQQKSARPHIKEVLPKLRGMDTPFWRAVRAVELADKVPRQSKVPDEAFIKANQNAFTVRQAATLLGVSKSTVSLRWKKLDLAPNFKSHRPKKIPDDYLIKAHSEGLSLSQAEELLGIKAQTIHYRWRKLGLKPNFPTGRPRKVSDDDLVKIHADGLSKHDAALALGVSWQTVNCRWERLGLDTDPDKKRMGRPKKITDEALMAAHADGLSQRNAAKLLGVSRATVYRRWKSLGLKPNYELSVKRNESE